MKFQKKVTSVLWNAEKGYYDVEIEDLTKPVDPATGRHPVINDYAHNVIWQGGNLNKWKLPDIQGLGKFKGKVMVSQNQIRSPSNRSDLYSSPSIAHREL